MKQVIINHINNWKVDSIKDVNKLRFLIDFIMLVEKQGIELRDLNGLAGSESENKLEACYNVIERANELFLEL